MLLLVVGVCVCVFLCMCVCLVVLVLMMIEAIGLKDGSKGKEREGACVCMFGG